MAGLGDGQAACLGAGVTSLDRAYLNLGTAVTGGPVGRRYLTDPSCRTLYGGHPARSCSSPYWDASATGTVIGWHHGHRRQHLFRAIEEGIAYEHRLAMEGIQAATGQRIAEHVILGGGSNSDLWCQIMADVLGAPVTRAHTAEATNLGSGILCAYGIGWYGSVEDAAASMTSVAATFQPEDRARAMGIIGALGALRCICSSSTSASIGVPTLCSNSPTLSRRPVGSPRRST